MTRRRLLGVLIVVVLVIGVTAAVTHDDSRYPAEWEDERVANLAAFVEEERGLEFEHPVFVDFLAEDEFNALVTTDEADLSDEDREEIEEVAAFLRALGLMAADVDLFESFNVLSEVGILAFYDPEDERVRVKGTDLTPGLRVTLVHELTHALQDQHFDLGRLEEVEEETDTSSFRALVEGDATRVENAYVESLDEDERAEVEEKEQADLEDFEEEDLPPVLAAILAAPYALGEPLATTIVEADGRDALDEALQDPPASDEPLLDPLGYLAGDEPIEVESPELADGEEEVDSGQFGAVGWYVMLAQRIDPATALAAVDGWGGDAYVAYDRDGTVCVRIAYRGDSADEAEELEDALTTWTREMPPGAATVARKGDDGLLLQSCDPGDDASVPDDVTVQDLMVLPATRSAITAAVLSQGANEKQARCFAHAVVREFSVDELVAEEASESMRRRISELAAGCR
jgi:hypothetical protein